ncbi:MAG: hypothetical protein Q8S84_03485 [bacterium]|nr:hypothetical protein [bacterium]MDP3380586.1 hypothetical protein [bacterium]
MNQEILNVNKFEFVQYRFDSIIVQITAANTGSLIEESTNSSFDTGVHIKTGNFKFFFDKFTNHLIFTPHHTHTAHSGNIPSLPTFFNSSLTKYRISSYLAVTILER